MPDALQLRDITAEQRGDVKEIPRAPVRGAQEQPELLERRLVPADRRTRLRRPGHERRIRRGEADEVGHTQSKARRTLERWQAIGDQLATPHRQTQAKL